MELTRVWIPIEIPCILKKTYLYLVLNMYGTYIPNQKFDLFWITEFIFYNNNSEKSTRIFQFFLRFWKEFSKFAKIK